MYNNPEKILVWSANLLFLASFVIYGVGVYLIQTRLCKHIGPDTAMIAVALCIFAAGILGGRALIARTLKAWVLLVLALLLVVVMYYFVGVLALPGCSGV
jgi:hypothetical protein